MALTTLYYRWRRSVTSTLDIGRRRKCALPGSEEGGSAPSLDRRQPGNPSQRRGALCEERSILHCCKPTRGKGVESAARIASSAGTGSPPPGAPSGCAHFPPGRRSSAPASRSASDDTPAHSSATAHKCRRFQQAPPGIIHPLRAVLPHLRRPHVGIGQQSSPLEAMVLPLPRRSHPRADGCR